MADREWNRLQEIHGNAGYTDGVVAGKDETVQAGFDKGYAEGIDIGHSIGMIIGALGVLLEYQQQLERKQQQKSEQQNKNNENENENENEQESLGKDVEDNSNNSSGSGSSNSSSSSSNNDLKRTEELYSKIVDVKASDALPANSLQSEETARPSKAILQLLNDALTHLRSYNIDLNVTL
ncbi:hypothetical protein GQ42DRAFT_163042 [Ramicandelaber brevisporus]|nr:hypothetical protein GQ42DRAFT_163042 [Ramicandelaber brevisporus]